MSQIDDERMDLERTSRGADVRREYFKEVRDNPYVGPFYYSWIHGANQSFEDMLMSTIVCLSREVVRYQKLITNRAAIRGIAILADSQINPDKPE